MFSQEINISCYIYGHKRLNYKNTRRIRCSFSFVAFIAKLLSPISFSSCYLFCVTFVNVYRISIVNYILAPNDVINLAGPLKNSTDSGLLQKFITRENGLPQ